MAQPFKLRYVNELVGIFVLIGLGVVIFGVVTALRARGWLLSEEVLQIKIELPVEGSLGLKPGNDVQVLGTVIGSVDAVNFDENTENMQATVSLRGSLVNYLRDNSIPVIHSSFGFGPSYIEIIKNENPKKPGEPLPKIGARLYYSRAAGGPAEKAQQIMVQVQDEIVPALHELRSLIQKHVEVADNLSKITGSIRNGEGLVGRLMSDPKMAEQINSLLPKLNAAFDEMATVLSGLGKTAGNLAEVTSAAKDDMKRIPALLDSTRDSLTELQTTLKDIRLTTAKLPEIVAGAGQTVTALPGVVLQLQETLRQIQILVEGVQKSWLVRSYIDKPDTGGRIRAEDLK